MPRSRDLVAELSKLVQEQAKTSLVESCQNTPHGQELALGLLLMRWAEEHDGIATVLRVAANAVEDNNYHKLANNLRNLGENPPTTPMKVVT